MEIDLIKLAKNNLTPNLYSILWSIANDEPYHWLEDNKQDNSYLETALKELEQNLWIKILTDSIELRSKAIKLGLGERDYTEDIKEVINHLNTKLDCKGKRGFKAATKGHSTPIGARLKEGYTASDLKNVIDEMYSRWYGGNMEAYLRPQTLFNATKFPGYFILVKKVKESNINEML